MIDWNEAITQWFSDSAPQGILITDAELNIRYWNRWLEVHSSRPATEMLERNLLEVYPELVERGLDRYYQGALEGQVQVLSQHFHGYLLPMPADVGRGTELMLQSAQIAPLMENNRVLGTVTVIEDVTERVLHEAELRESEDRFRRLTENAQDIIYRYRFIPTPGFEYVSPAVTAITGYTPEECYADPDLGLKIVHPDDRPQLEKYFQTEGMWRQPVALRWVHKDGTLIWIEQHNVPFYDEAGNLVAIEGIARDITERVRAEEEIAQHNLELELLLDTATVASSTLELDRLLHILAEKMATLLEVTFCRIALLDETNQALAIRAASPIRGLDWDPGLGRQYSLTDAPWHRRAIETGETMVLRQDDPSRAVSETECRIALSEGIQSALLIPLMMGDRILGVVSLGEMRRWERTPFTADRVRLCQAMANQAAIAIENSRLYHEADEARRRYQDLYDNAPVMYHTIDTKGIVLECNQTEADMLGYSKEEIVGQPIYAFETKEYRDLAPHALREGMEKGHAVGERRFVKKDGTVIDALLDAQAIYDDSGQVVGFRSTLTDITERVRMEEALRESEERYRTLFDGVPVGLYRTAPEGKILDANPALVQIMGYPDRESLLAVNVADGYASAEDRARWQALMEREDITRNFQVQWRRRDGTAIWVEENARAVRDTDGQVLYYEGSIQDITARKGEELAVAEERSRIAREIHDAIIQELSSLGLGLDFCIKEVERDSATVRQELTRIRELLRHNIRELRHTILALRPVELEKQGLVPALEQHVGEWGRRTGIQIHVSVVGGPVELPVEVEMALLRMVQESLNNVRKHAAAHQVWVTLDTSRPTTVSLTVRDDGRGFDTSTTAATSIGLGLKQMHERAEAVGGRLEILATPGEGTEVHFILPRGSPRVNE